MNFDLSPEQQLLQDSIVRFVQDNYALEQRQAITSRSPGFSAEHWAQMAELGWLALSVAESDGGFGGGLVDTMLLMEQFGKGLVVEPYLASIVLGGTALAAGSEGLRGELMPKMIDGSAQLALAYAEEQARFDLHDVATIAKAEGDQFVVSGTKSMVSNAKSASHIIVSARTANGQLDRNGITLLLIAADAEGVKIHDFPTVDGGQAAEVELTEVRVSEDYILGRLDQGLELLERAVMHGILAVCAEAVGAMEVLYKDTVAYTQEREQFDHPLSDFQVIQHRLVDMFMEYEQCKSLLYRATLEAQQGGLDAMRTVHALKYMIGETGVRIGEEAVQLHGGMGMTEELRIGHYFKRLLVIDAQFGNADHHLQLFAA